MGNRMDENFKVITCEEVAKAMGMPIPTLHEYVRWLLYEDRIERQSKISGEWITRKINIFRYSENGQRVS